MRGADEEKRHVSHERRRFMAGVSALGAGALLPSCATEGGARMSGSQIERNKAVAMRFKKLQGTQDEPKIESEVLAPGYKRLRGGMLNLANNAREQGFPATGPYLRGAFPDRVGLLFRLTGTHKGNLFGIPPTGKKVDVHEAAILRIVDGRVFEGWFLADEAGLLKQLGAGLPKRKDGKVIAPPITKEGLSGDAMYARLQAKPPATEAERNKLVVASSKTSKPPKGYRAEDYKQLRQGFQHLRNYGVANGVAKQTPTLALPDRADLIDDLLAEGKWKTGWYFGDELGMMLQLDALHMLGDKRVDRG